MIMGTTRWSHGNEVYNVTATYICKDFTGQIVVDKNKGKDASFFVSKPMGQADLLIYG
jgi:hypothetical protein